MGQAAPVTPDGPAPVSSIKIDGFDVNTEDLDSPMAIRWWQSKHRYTDVWLPPQRAVFDVDQQDYSVDLQTRWHTQEPEHRGVCVRYLSFSKSVSNPRKRQRRHW